MIYVLSDIHGDYKKYRMMLQKIRLKEEDTLFVLGDVLDRGPDGIRVLQDMMMASNVIPILGNHEYMAANVLPWLSQEITEETSANLSPEMIRGLTEWMEVGGESTIRGFQKLSSEEREDLLDYLSEFSLYETVSTDMGDFILVHAGLGNYEPEKDLSDYTIAEILYDKPDYSKIYDEDAVLVTGHLPTRVIFAEQSGKNIEQVEESQYRDEIYFKNHHLAIDCGCGFGGRLGCVRLDDLKFFYVD